MQLVYSIGFQQCHKYLISCSVVKALRLTVFAVVLIALLLGALNRAHAATVSAIVAIPDRSQASFKLASEQALEQLLSRSSIVPIAKIKEAFVVQEAFKQASRHVKQFSYVDVSAKVLHAVGSSGVGIATSQLNDASSTQLTEQDTALALVAHFDRQWVQGLLQETGQAFLLADRPKLLALFVIKGEGGLRLLGASTSESGAGQEREQDILESLAIRFGIPLQALPQSQLNALKLESLWYFNQDYMRQLLHASSANSIMVIRLAETSDQRLVGGSFYLTKDLVDAEQFGRDISKPDLIAATQAAFRSVNAQWLKTRALTISRSANELALSIQGLNDFADLRSLLVELEAMSMVEHSYVLEVDATHCLVSVILKSDASQFVQQLRKIPQLRALANGQQQGYQLQYQWQN